MTVLVAIGHSHLASVRNAARLSPAPFADVRIVALRNPELTPNLVMAGDRPVLNEAVASAIRRAADGADLAALMLNGNEHFLFGVAAHPRAV